jgi:glycine oxidase
MLSVTMPSKNLLRHVVRAPNVYLIPRSNGLLAIGATLEEAGFDKQTVPETIKRLHQSALELLPELKDGRILEAWAGLRPGTPDSLPILGATAIAGYYVAAGHYRDGILLAPATAKIMTQLISGARLDFDLDRFSLLRFGGKAA